MAPNALETAQQTLLVLLPENPNAFTRSPLDRAGHLRCDEGWLALALERVRAFAAANPGVFTVEMMRQVLTEVPAPPDLRAWGRVTQDAIRLGYIERVPKVVIPAASSNGSVKPAWRRGANA